MGWRLFGGIGAPRGGAAEGGGFAPAAAPRKAVAAARRRRFAPAARGGRRGFAPEGGGAATRARARGRRRWLARARPRAATAQLRACGPRRPAAVAEARARARGGAAAAARPRAELRRPRQQRRACARAVEASGGSALARARGRRQLGYLRGQAGTEQWRVGFRAHAAAASSFRCSDLMEQSLFLVGEIGGNDYNLPLLSRAPIEKIRTFTPSVVAKISSTITELIGLGAKTLVVPGNLPIGCVPKYLLIFKSDNKKDYEPETGCLRWMNEFSQYHNKLLMEELEKLRKLHSGVKIIYADYYEAAMEIFHSPERFGIEEPLVACCGGGGPYGVSLTATCGYGEYKVCDNPDKYGSWDGFHPSEAAYKAIAIGLLRGSYTQPSIASTSSSCPQLTELSSSVEYKNRGTVLHFTAVAQVIGWVLFYLLFY